MTSPIEIDLINELSKVVNAKREYRDKAVQYVCQHPESFQFLIKIVFKNDDQHHITAAWVFELVCTKNLTFLKNHLTFFIEHLHKISKESALRPVSKVCNLIVNSWNKQVGILPPINQSLKEQIIETNFDWLINDYKVATQVHAMDTLYIMGKDFEWIHPELQSILLKHITEKSAGYKARAKKILSRIKH